MSAIDRHLDEMRQGLRRVRPHEAAAAMRGGALLVDTRPSEQRRCDGEIPGAMVIDRNVLEWRLDPTSSHRIPEMTGPGTPVIVLCNEGYSSTLAAATLRRLGLEHVSDVIGGFQAWAAAGLPVVGGPS